MKKILVPVVTAALACSLSACGPDKELVKSGKDHTCALEELAKKLKADPGNQKLHEEIRERSVDLKVVIGSAGEGKQAALKEAIANEVAKGCH